MPKLPTIKAKQLIKALKKFGFFEHRQKGTSHLIMAHPDSRRASIPVHQGKDIPKGTLKGILRGLEISTEEFISFLEK
ncbi:MAG: type II toxin-antitoxin system HicA family toxin [Patescibacteria group bacterium]|nr:type II toxin-antitoxin system HicA family toxin [Patescibacteria group bacterium]